MHLKRYALSIGFLVYSLILVASILSTNANAATTYYISPGQDGLDSPDAGTSPSAPWKTFSFAIPKLRAGDTLILLDGTYTNANSGLPYIDCSSNAKSGTDKDHPITVKALNERQAHLQGSGNNVFQITHCSFWVIEGIYSSNIDVQIGGFEGSNFVLDLCHDIIMRRNLAYGANAWFNSHGIALYNTDNSLLEENEVYYVTRHGIIQGWNTSGATPTGNVLRRNYVHSRGHDSMPGGFTCEGSCQNHKGDEGISCYPCNNSTFENNIVEDWQSGFSIQAKADTFNNKYYGNIALNTGPYGSFGFTARSDTQQNTAGQMPTNIVVENNVVINGTGIGCRTCKNLVLKNNTVMNSTGGFAADQSCGVPCGEGGDGHLSVFGTNLLAMNNNGLGFSISQQETSSFDHVVSFNNSGGDGFGSLFTNALTSVNPNLGTCKVFIPDGSPLKRAGVDGADIGANILSRYQDGVLLTNTPLWDPTTGRFPCGVQVAGVNDIAGSSCFDVHTRLNVNTNGCTLPTAPTAVLPKPTNLRLLGSQP